MTTIASGAFLDLLLRARVTLLVVAQRQTEDVRSCGLIKSRKVRQTDERKNKTTMVKIAKEPKEIANRVAEFLLDGDIEAIPSMFHPDCKVFMPPTEPPTVGKEAIKELFRPFCGMKPIMESRVISEVILGDTALLQAEWKMKDGSGNVVAEGQSTEVAKQLENGGWVYYIDCPNGPPQL